MAASCLKSGLIVLPVELSTLSSKEDGSPQVSITAVDLPSSPGDRLVPLYVACQGSVSLALVELVKFTRPYGSWMLVPEDITSVPELCSNGNLTFITKVDPLFAMLVLLDYNSQVGAKPMFQPLHDLCVTPDGMHLGQFCPEEQLSLLCDFKTAANQSFYRLNNEKVLHWLLEKHNVLSHNCHANSKHAEHIISQYLNQSWTKRFKAALSSQCPEAQHAGVSTAELATPIMMEETKEDKPAAHTSQGSNKRKQPERGNTTPSKKKNSTLNKLSAQWKASREKSSTKTAKSPTLRKKLSRSSSTK